MATDQERLLLLLEAQTRGFERALARAESVADVNAQKIARHYQNMNRRVQADFNNFADQARTALAALGVGLVVRDVTQLADVWTTVGNRLAFAGVSAERLASAQQAVANIASETRSDLDATADLFARMFRSSEDLGASMERVLRVTEIVSKALAGASQSERQGAIRQLGQGLGSGRLQGDELRSILENSRPIAEAIAREFETTVGNLRTLGAQGVLESRRVFEAIERAGADIDASFNQTTFTVADSFTRLRTEAARFIGTNEETSASVRGLTALVDSVANNFDLLADAVIITATVIGGSFAGTAVARAVQALSAMILAMTTTQTRAATLSRALSFFGGPLGIALTVAGGAMAYLATQTDVFASKAQLLQSAEDSLYSALQVITNLEVASEGAADETGRVADEANRAAAELDEMTGSATSAAGAAEDLASAAADLAVVERERALATIEAAIADREALVAAERRARFIRNLANILGAVGDPDEQRLRLAQNERLNQEGETLVSQAEDRIQALERVRERLASGQLQIARSTSPDGEDGPTNNDPTNRASRRNALADLQRDADLRLARLLNEEARARALEDAAEIEQRTAAYVEAGLALTQARSVAEAEVTAERAAMNAEAQRSYEISQLQDAIDLERLQNNIGLADAMSDQLEIARRTTELAQQLAISETEAAQMAREYVEARRAAVDAQRAQELELRSVQDDAEAARLRGDDRAERAANRRLELEGRIRELRDLGLTEDVATARAEAEIDALEQADFQGQFRRWFTGGITAALEGDLDDFFETWIRDRAAAGLESALNQVADILFESFQGILTNVIRGGQDGLGQAVSAVFSGGASAGLNQLGDGATKAGEALGVVLAASAAEAGSKIAITGAIAAASAAKESASAASKSAASLSVTSSSLILAKSLLAAASAAQVFAASSGGGKSGITGLVTSVIGSVLKFGGGKANGGMVSPGNWYNVGERGPERFVPSVPGYIVPNGGFGGGAPVVNVVDRSVYNITGASTAEVAQLRAQMRNDQATRRQQTIGHVREALRRPRVLG